MLKGNLIKIAIVDDDEDDFFVIEDYIKGIKANLQIFWIRDYDTAITSMMEMRYNIYLVDYRLGNETGLTLLKEAVQSGCEEPIILLTGKGNREIDIQAMQGGATDYLVKSELNTEKIERCIRYSLERTAALKELKSREAKYRGLFRNSKDAIVIMDPTLVITEANQASSQLFEHNMDELAGRNLCEFVKSEEQRDIILRSVGEKMDILDLSLDIHSANKEIKPCLLSITFHQDSEGDWLLHAILHDITNIRRAELSNLQAQKLAANERLMRTIAHEIRNPLNNISLSIEHYDTEDEDSGLQKEMVSIIQRNCKRIDQSITELLNITRTSQLDFKKHTLQEIMNESIASVMDRLHLQNIRMEKSFQENPLEISADKSKLKIAFSNILINAIEAMQDKTEGRQLAISMFGSPNGSVVSIRDNGVGIAEENLSKLFEPFFTLKKNGVGLGLAVSYSILQSHKADIEVRSTLSKGTNFVIHFAKSAGTNGTHMTADQLQEAIS